MILAIANDFGSITFLMLPFSHPVFDAIPLYVRVLLIYATAANNLG